MVWRRKFCSIAESWKVNIVCFCSFSLFFPVKMAYVDVCVFLCSWFQGMRDAKFSWNVRLWKAKVVSLKMKRHSRLPIIQDYLIVTKIAHVVPSDENCHKFPRVVETDAHSLHPFDHSLSLSVHIPARQKQDKSHSMQWLRPGENAKFFASEDFRLLSCYTHSAVAPITAWLSPAWSLSMLPVPCAKPVSDSGVSPSPSSFCLKCSIMSATKTSFLPEKLPFAHAVCFRLHIPVCKRTWYCHNRRWKLPSCVYAAFSSNAAEKSRTQSTSTAIRSVDPVWWFAIELCCVDRGVACCWQGATREKGPDSFSLHFQSRGLKTCFWHLLGISSEGTGRDFSTHLSLRQEDTDSL